MPLSTEGRLRLLSAPRTNDSPNVDQTFERRIDELKRRARTLDEQIVRTSRRRAFSHLEAPHCPGFDYNRRYLRRRDVIARRRSHDGREASKPEPI
jgi:hypothetical protein